MDPPETQNSRDARIEALWQKLDPQKKGELNVENLRRGLKRINHPLKNAQDMIEDVVKAMDKNGDKIIQYEEFRTFVENTERELLVLFQSIDRDRDGKLDKDELQAAFKRAGLTVPSSKLGQFFNEVDGNHDGYINFEEWRNFLLFLPHSKNAPLKAVLSYYSSAVSLNAEGDTSIREDTLEGLGSSQVSYLTMLFGAIVNITKIPPPIRVPPASPLETLDDENELEDGFQSSPSVVNGEQTLQLPMEAQDSDRFIKDVYIEELKALIPDQGYFMAGALAGVFSRTLTAPLDRLKVYLIANVDTGNTVAAAKAGDGVKAVRQFAAPLRNAFTELYRSGGLRTLFAGNGLNVLKVMPESGIKFGSYEAAKRILARLEGHNDPKDINPYSKFLAGGFGGMVSQFVVYPMDTVKFRMQCETVSGGLQGNKLIQATCKKMYQQGGIRTYYRGLTMGLVGMFPYAALDLGTFEFLKGTLVARRAKLRGCDEEDAALAGWEVAGVGAFSGAFGASVVYPINLLRTRLQAQGTVLHKPTYTGVVDVFQKTIKNEGPRGLFKGLAPNLLKVIPAVGITWTVYEGAKKALHLS